MKPIRVLQVLTSLERGGAETMVMNYYRSLNRSLVQFDFLIYREQKGAFEDEVLSMGGQIHRLPGLSIRQLKSYIRSHDEFFEKHTEYSIVHTHTNAYAYWLLKVAKARKVPVRIAHSHTSIEPILNKVFQKNTDLPTTLKDTLQTFLKIFVPKLATDYFACSLKAGNWLFGKNNKDQVRVITNAVNTDLFTYNSHTAQRMKSELKVSGKKVIGHVGNFVEAKNHLFLLEVFARMLQKNGGLVLILAGDGYLRKRIEKECLRLGIEKNTQILGVREDIPELMQTFDLFLFPSLYEGLPLTLIEGQATGLRVIASDSITNEVELTNLITFEDLKKGSQYWANKALERVVYQRKASKNKIRESGYDISHSAKALEAFYIKKYNSYVRN